MALLVLEKKDILKHYGQSYVAEATRFEGTPPVITALASGELDVGPLAFSSFGLAIQNAHMDDLRVISDEIQDGVAGHGSDNEFGGAWRRADQDRGRSEGQSARHQRHGQRRRHRHAGDAECGTTCLEANKDYTLIVEAPFPAMKSGSCLEKKADLISAAAAVLARSRAARHGKNTLFTQKDAFGITQPTMWTARTGFIDKNCAALVDFLEDTVRAVSAGLAILRTTIAGRHRGPVAQQGAAGAHGMGVRPKARLYTATRTACRTSPRSQSNLQLQKQVGFLKGTISTPKTYSDLSMVGGSGETPGIIY